MRGYFESGFPFDGHFGPRFGPMGGPPTCPFRGDFPGHHGRRPGFGPFGRHGFDHSPERHGRNHSPERHGDDHHGPEHHRRGPAEDGRRGERCGRHASSDSDNEGPAECHCHGVRGGPSGRPHDFHRHGPSCHFPGPWFGRDPCFGRRGPCERPWKGPWEGPWGAGHPMHGFGRFGHRRPCPYNSDERPSRNANCDKCRENEPCCSGNKKNRGCGRGRKENGPCHDKDKDQNPNSDTVFVQRIILEKPQGHNLFEVMM